MIVACKAFPRREAAGYVERRAEYGHAMRALVGAYDHAWIVSITDPESPPVFAAAPRVLPLSFHDIDPDRPLPLIDDGRPHLDLVAITPRDATRVVDFVRRAHADPTTRDVLIANCHAGVSRSGAVVDFARRACGVDYDAFKRMNPAIVPNAYVLRLLHEAWQTP